MDGEKGEASPLVLSPSPLIDERERNQPVPGNEEALAPLSSSHGLGAARRGVEVDGRPASDKVEAEAKGR